MSIKEQVSVLQSFRDGDINCLFATPVAEEGIDIPSCDLVIRFDVYNTVIQYIQSRGRARQRESRYITMIEVENRDHFRRVNQASRDATILQKFCSALPEDRKVQDQLADIWAAEAAAAHTSRTGHNVVYTDKQARLGLDNSLGVLSRFVSSLSTSMVNYSPEFVVMPVGSKFIADIILPDCSPVTRVSGFPQRSKQMARSSAAFEACKLLLKGKHIDGHLQSTLVKILPRMRNARLAVSLKKKKDYKMRAKPAIWSQVGGEVPGTLFATVLTLEEPGKVGKPTRPLILLTRQKLPELPVIPLFFGDGSRTMARPVVMRKPLEFTAAQVESLRSFTLRIFDHVFSKSYEASSSELPYFLAPAKESHVSVLGSGLASVDWDTVDLVKDTDSLDWDKKPDEFYQDKFVIDLFDGSRKLVLRGINKNLRPSDQEPADAPAPRSREFRLSDKTIKDYSISLWPKAKKRRTWREDQPVIDADLLPLRRNFLDQFSTTDTANTKCAVILEPLQVSPVSTFTVDAN
jgi:endoribonuclease Dicer